LGGEFLRFFLLLGRTFFDNLLQDFNGADFVADLKVGAG
jgi:hypothetical protein